MFFCLLGTFWRYIYINFLIQKVIKKSPNSSNEGFSYCFCLVIDGSKSRNVRDPEQCPKSMLTCEKLMLNMQDEVTDEEKVLKSRTSFVGTAQYVSPEVLTSKSSWLFYYSCKSNVLIMIYLLDNTIGNSLSVSGTIRIWPSWKKNLLRLDTSLSFFNYLNFPLNFVFSTRYRYLFSLKSGSGSRSETFWSVGKFNVG